MDVSLIVLTRRPQRTSQCREETASEVYKREYEHIRVMGGNGCYFATQVREWMGVCHVGLVVCVFRHGRAWRI